MIPWRNWLVGIQMRPILWGVTGYLAAYSILVGLFNLEFSEALSRSTLYIWFSFCAPPLVAGLLTGVAANGSRLVDHVALVLCALAVIGAVMWSGDSLGGRLVGFVVLALPGMIVGAFLGKRLRAVLDKSVGFIIGSVTRRDWALLLAAAALPVYFWSMSMMAQKSEQTALCDGSGKVDETCARSKCTDEVRHRLRNKVGDHRAYSTSEHELVRERISGYAADQEVWVMRGSVSRFAGVSSEGDSHQIYFCVVRDDGVTWIKASNADSDRYPPKGSILREAFESEWKR